MRKRILVFTAFLPNEAAAGEKNSMLMIKDLSAHYSVDVAYFKYDNQEEYKPANDNINIIRIFRNSTKVKVLNALKRPFLFPVFTIRYSRSIKKWLQSLVVENRYEAIIFEHSQMLLYAKGLETDALKILFSQDVMYQRISRSQNGLIAWFCKRTENYCLHTENSCSFTISKKDAQLVEQLYGVPSEYSVAYIDDKIIDAVPSQIDDNYVFIGKWSRADNLDGVIWFFDKVAPLIKKKIKVTILGKNFPAEKINNPNPLIDISIPGFVDNPYPMIANSKAMLAPIFTGAGVKQKVLESLACGTPVIGTDVAFEGISTDYQKYMKLVSHPEDYAGQIHSLGISIDERILLKKDFLSNYSKKNVTNYLLEKTQKSI